MDASDAFTKALWEINEANEKSLRAWVEQVSVLKVENLQLVEALDSALVLLQDQERIINKLTRGRIVYTESNTKNREYLKKKGYLQ